MTAFNRSIAAATLVGAMILAPGLAAADDDRDEQYDRHDRNEQFDRQDRHERGERRDLDPRYLAPPAAPGWATRDDFRWYGRGRFGAGWERHERVLQVRAVRHELFELERDRADFYARHAYRPWLLARYDAAYFERHAELERQLERLTTYAWR